MKPFLPAAALLASLAVSAQARDYQVTFSGTESVWGTICEFDEAPAACTTPSPFSGILDVITPTWSDGQFGQLLDTGPVGEGPFLFEPLAFQLGSFMSWSTPDGAVPFFDSSFMATIVGGQVVAIVGQATD